MPKHTVDEEFRLRFPESHNLAERALQLIPSGVTHDARYLPPFAPYIERAEGSRKWDADGGELIDYWMGHGALILGHCHPAIVQAVHHQMSRGTHYGGSHRLEIEWAQWIHRLMPAAEKMRFVSSGTEATQLAMRLARAFTGRSKIVKFEGHFHGWHDYAAPAVVVPFEVPAISGVPKETLESTVVAPPNDPQALEAILERDPDIAAVILEPGGGAWGALPIDPEFVRALRRIVDGHGVLLIFDEVVTGFRLAKGGAQEHFGVLPDLICLAKIVAGGLPGGAVAGRADILERLAFHPDDPHWNRYKKIAHQGTFNANPLSAAAGITALGLIEEGSVIPHCDRMCRLLVDGLNRVLDQSGADGYVYGESSMFHIALNYRAAGDKTGGKADGGPLRTEHRVSGRPPVATGAAYARLAEVTKGSGVHLLRKAMLLNGIDLMRSGGFLSVSHTEVDVEQTVTAFGRALERLLDEGWVAPKADDGGGDSR